MTPASRPSNPPRAPANAMNSPATVAYARTVDAAQSADSSHAWNRASMSVSPAVSLPTVRE
ncbi:MAG: hypothetical protein WCC47_24360 [Pseudonocardiaceae bacterium]